ncbi:NAD-dependent epimerase/dehydratase family protein [Photorhabdus heterorhabditis]|uniref:NAD-dependent epimerase/dehydratase family protein n=1 Tax=Photorhabdus heterorhabditis TaxID=880156 RepID=UPI001561ED2D|nr:NAD-dependent epimerase/dehydratase family protein [Photorhabdus heterorhabditis]NRN29559.1 NAD-dependent epimerase/dehydratase family protein [Photorhabdus heterorhabditis subsp. aluminescens]
MILLTGSTGFVGRAILNKLSGKSIKALGRVRPANQLVDFFSGSIDANTDYSLALEDVKVVIHSAARVHITNDSSLDPLAAYREINTEGTLNLARQAAQAGVNRFIFISTIGVNGGRTIDHPFRISDLPSPWDFYSQSKYEAEIGLWDIQATTGMEIVVIRSPLVYGPNAPGNFGKLVNAIATEHWLPLGAIHNKRSFVALDNLVDLIITCIDHPNAANQTFLISDDQDVSTTEFMKKIADALGKPSKLIPIPMGFIRFVAGIIGKKSVAERLCDSLQIDISHTKYTLNWVPPVTMEQQLIKTATVKFNQ